MLSMRTLGVCVTWKKIKYKTIKTIYDLLRLKNTAPS